MTLDEATIRQWMVQAAAATPGPWTCTESAVVDDHKNIVACFNGSPLELSYWKPDAEFIAAARDAVPRLAEELIAAKEMDAERADTCLALAMQSAKLTASLERARGLLERALEDNGDCTADVWREIHAFIMHPKLRASGASYCPSCGKNPTEKP